jgi:hypothetical protein
LRRQVLEHRLEQGAGLSRRLVRRSFLAPAAALSWRAPASRLGYSIATLATFRAGIH